MPLYPTWQDIAVRLALAVVAGAILGLDRGARGQAAGLRTTILVALAASVAMSLANELLPVAGKTSESFATADVMRLPLGILTGVGFLGGGAILKRGDIVRGVTTAATLWTTTVVGLCFGSGQLGLGLAGTGLAFLTLFVLDWLDRRIPREHHARLVVAVAKGTSPAVVPDALEGKGWRAHLLRQAGGDTPDRIELGYELRWRRAEVDGDPTELLSLINAKFDLVSFDLISEAPA